VKLPMIEARIPEIEAAKVPPRRSGRCRGDEYRYQRHSSFALEERPERDGQGEHGSCLLRDSGLHDPPIQDPDDPPGLVHDVRVMVEKTKVVFSVS